MNATLKRKVKRVRLKEKDVIFEEMEDPVAVEKALRIKVNGRDLLRLYCTPLMVRELVVGLLLTEEIIKGSWCAERMEIVYGEEIVVDVVSELSGEVTALGGEVTITSGCAGGVTFEKKEIRDVGYKDLRVRPEVLKNLFNEFQMRSDLYKSTGCIHSAALSDGRILIAFAEDIGRHNAIDKVIGYAVLEDIKLGGKIMFASGRLSSEMISKCARWSIPLVVSRTAPTTRALDIAEKAGMTVVGFMRGDRFNIYTHPERIL